MITIAFFFASCALDIAVFIPSSHSLPLQDPKRCKSLERRKKNKQKKNVVGWRWKWLGIRSHYRWSDMLHNDSKCKLKESVACSNIYTCSNNCQSRQSSAKREPGAGREMSSLQPNVDIIICMQLHIQWVRSCCIHFRYIIFHNWSAQPDDGWEFIISIHCTSHSLSFSFAVWLAEQFMQLLLYKIFGYILLHTKAEMSSEINVWNALVAVISPFFRLSPYYYGSILSQRLHCI